MDVNGSVSITVRNDCQEGQVDCQYTGNPPVLERTRREW